MQRGVRGAAMIAERASGSEKYYPVMVTLTYRPEVEWSPRHVADFNKRIRRFLEREGEVARYVWVLELTARGRPHYHVIAWVRNGVMLPKPDRVGWWPHGSTRIERVRSAVGYIAKYASKGFGDGSDLPRGARLWGCGGLGREGRAELRYRLLPLYVQSSSAIGDHVVRCKGPGGWINHATGQWWPPWVPAFVDGQLTWRDPNQD